MLETLQLAVLAVMFACTLGVGLLFAARTDRALALQQAYAERVSSTKPSENPEYYEETREYRRGVFLLGGVVLSLVGLGGLVFVGFAVLVA